MRALIGRPNPRPAMSHHMELKDYGMSRERGYLSHYEIDEITLPEQFAPILDAAGKLSALLTTGRVRHWLDALPDPQIGEWVKTAPEEEVRTAMVHYSFLVQAYVWGEPEPPKHLPANLGRPMCEIADRLGQAPLLPYSGYVLDNWYRLDKSGPITLDNIAMYQNFFGGADENWFVLVNAPPLGSGYDWVAQGAAYRARVLATLARFGHDLRGRIVSETIWTPHEIRAHSGAWRGALYGASPNSRWAAFRRPHNRCRDVAGLYFAGGTTHPGGGVPLVALSGAVAARLLLADFPS